MNDTYVIIAGEYSDWSIVGYCNSEEEAAQRCIQYNDDEKNYYNDKWSYQRAKPMPQIDLPKIPFTYTYCIRAWKCRDGWRFQKEDDIHIEFSLKHLNHTGVEITKIDRKWRHDEFAEITLQMNEFNNEKALKIAQDMLYKKLAELDNL